MRPDPGLVPPALTPGASGEPQPRNSLDEIPEGARSPAVSETSHFTSVSQRGINPRWQPSESEIRRAQQEQQDILLGSNPDFELPRSRGRGRPMRGGRMPAVPAMPANIPGAGGGIPGGVGRYPLPR